MKKTIVFGPPGTGKTTYLLSLLEEALHYMSPSEIAFVSFTRKGAYEGITRAKEKFNYPEKEFCYFRTIHSLAFRMLSLRRDDVISGEDYREFSDAVGLRLLGVYNEEYMSSDDRYLFCEQLIRNNQEKGLDYLETLDVNRYAFVVKNYLAFKKHKGVIDFTDMLERYLYNGPPVPVKMAFIDEAQDLTPLQWAVVDRMFQDVETLVVAGDDDQAIYEWAGADVTKFLEREGEKIVLNQSYRLPQSVFSLAQGISGQIKVRENKVYYPRQEEGLVLYESSIADCVKSIPEGTLVLSRNNAYLKSVSNKLKEWGVPHSYKGVPSVNKRVLKAIEAFEDYRLTGCSDKAKIYAGYYTRDYLDKKYWQNALNLPAKEVYFYEKVLSSASENQGSIINLETVHSAKGSEADNVLLLLDISRKVYEHYLKSPDDELRVFYVGVTRAKKNLVLKLSETPYSYSLR